MLSTALLNLPVGFLAMTLGAALLNLPVGFLAMALGAALLNLPVSFLAMARGAALLNLPVSLLNLPVSLLSLSVTLLAMMLGTALLHLAGFFDLPVTMLSAALLLVHAALLGFLVVALRWFCGITAFAVMPQGTADLTQFWHYINVAEMS